MFYLGAHHPGWLRDVNVPLFVSARRLRGRRRLPRASGPWALDSGAFTELQQHGRWTVSPEDYVALARRCMDEVGRMDFAAQMDWMCEPIVLAGGTVNGVRFAGTGLSVREHQRRTIANYLTLTHADDGIPWLPVIQGWEPWEYTEHVRAWERELGPLKGRRFGVGSVCRRQGTLDAEWLVTLLKAEGLKLHLFGFKRDGLLRVARLLGDGDSADSMAWSFDARRSPPMPGHEGRHKSCANCREYALAWRGRLLADLAAARRRPRQLLIVEG